MKTLQSPALQAINDLDFTLIKAELQKKGWTDIQTEITEMWYKRFWTIKAKYPECRLVPNRAIDDFWHAHVLDTKKYQDDCQAVFGYFLHHAPSYGKKDHSADFKEINTLYHLEFGEDCTSMFPEEMLALECTNCDDSMHEPISKNKLVLASECEDSDGGQSDQD